jgi:hypothetical protein
MLPVRDANAAGGLSCQGSPPADASAEIGCTRTARHDRPAWPRPGRHRRTQASAGPPQVVWLEHRQPAASAGARRRVPAVRATAPGRRPPPPSPREWEQWLTVSRKAMPRNGHRPAGRTPDEVKLRLLHAHCHPHYARSSKSPALLIGGRTSCEAAFIRGPLRS